MYLSRKSRTCYRPVMKSYVTPLIFLWAFSAPVFAQASEQEGTPDVIDVTEPPQFPGSIEMPGSLSEQDKNLILSAYTGDLSKIEVMVAKGANVNVQDQKKRTPLIFAATNGHTSAVAFLISQGAEVNAKDSGGRTALLYASKRSFNETAALLLDKGADVNVQSKKKGITALMLAAVWDNVELVQMLLKHGADVQLTDTFGRTARILAQKKGNTAVIDLLPDSPTADSEQ
jgi:ankyrin repeat protein